MSKIPVPDSEQDFDRAAIESVEDPFARLRILMKRLLDPGGCPWDREQNHKTLRPYLIEEAYEVCEAIDSGDWDHLREELGDLGLQIVFHSELAERAGRFRIEDVYATICTKLLDRHPHVFGATIAKDAAAVLKNWEQIKKAERTRKAGTNCEAKPSILDGVPKDLPALQRATRLQEKASRVGFDWDSAEGVKDKVREELAEFLEASESGDASKTEHEFGDLLFSLVNLSRFMSIDAEGSLRFAIERFRRRFRYIEDSAERSGRELKDMTPGEMNDLWEEAKRSQLPS